MTNHETLHRLLGLARFGSLSLRSSPFSSVLLADTLWILAQVLAYKDGTKLARTVQISASPPSLESHLGANPMDGSLEW